MVKNDYFKAVLISLIFSFAVLIVLPRIPVVIHSWLYKIDSFIGGYEFNIFGLNVDLRGFKGSVDVQGGKRIILSVEKDANYKGQDSLLSLINIIEKRLLVVGISDYEIGIEDINEGKIYISVPKFADFNRISQLVIGSGEIEIKKLANPDSWDINNASEIIMKPEEWTSTGLKNNEITDLKLLKDAKGQDQIQIVFNQEGRDKFKEFLKDSLNKPFSININGSDYPVAVPIVSQSLLDKPDSDPMITGNLPYEIVKDYIIQMKNPFTSKVNADVGGDIEAKLGNDFLSTYLLSILAGLILSFGYLILKFRKYGLIGSISLILSLSVFLSCFKIFSLVINVPSIVSFLLLNILLFDMTNSVLSTISSKEISDRPITLVIKQGFDDNVEVFRLISTVTFISAFALSYFISDDTRFFALTLLIGVLTIVFHYFYSLKTFMELFGENK